MLRQLTVPVVALSTCRAVYDRFVSGWPTTTAPCSAPASGNEGVCTGDDGGPLVIDGKLAGVVSFRVGCGRYPDFYTRVSACSASD